MLYLPRRVNILEGELAPIGEIATALSRVLRWNGATLVPWSVLQHLLSGERMVSPERPIERLYWLLHDVDEAWTGDIPRPHKTREQRWHGEDIRSRVYKQHGVPLPQEATVDRIRELDDVMASAEASVLLHPAARADVGLPAAGNDAIDAVYRFLDVPVSDLVDLYVGAVGSLLASREVKSLGRSA